MKYLLYFLILSLVFTFGYIIRALLERANEAFDSGDVWYRGFNAGIGTAIDTFEALEQDEDCPVICSRMEELKRIVLGAKENVYKS